MNAIWKQPTPVMQMISLIGAVEGNLSLLEDQIGNPEMIRKRLQSHVSEMQELIPYLEGKQEWIPAYPEQKPSNSKRKAASPISQVRQGSRK